MSPKKFRFACFLAAACALPAAPVFAADLDQPIMVDQAPEYTPVEVGNGWYLRGDIGYQVEDAYDIGEHTNKHYGVTPMEIDASEREFTGSLGAGYHFTDYLRADINVGYIPGAEADIDYDDGGNREHADLSNDVWYGMANAYVDLGTYAGFTPYVGAGIGLVSNRGEVDARYDNGGAKRELEKDDRSNSIGYALNAGLAYRFTDNLSVDVGYQFITAPDAEYYDVTDLDNYRVREGLDFHQIRAGLRYDLW